MNLAIDDIPGPGGNPFSDASRRVFMDTSQCFIDSYATLTRHGFTPEDVARSMLAAAVNFYQIFEIHQALPETLRMLADSLEDRHN